MSCTSILLEDPSLPPPLTTEALQHLRNQLGAAVHPAQAIALLEVGASGCALLISEGMHGHPTPVVHHMPLGLGLLTQRTFKKAMPTEAQLEAGIMVVEDAVMPLQRLIPPSAVLASGNPLLLGIARLAVGQRAPEAMPTLVSRDAIEALFSRLVAQASRGWGRADPELPSAPNGAAALLILREALHHWQFNQLCLLPETPFAETPV